MLARDMGMTASELEQRMSGDELLEHMADYTLEPWGQEKQDLRTAAMMEVQASTFGGKLDRRKAFNSLRPQRERQPEQTPDQMKAMLRMLG